jgi:GxxExxY protein
MNESREDAEAQEMIDLVQARSCGTESIEKNDVVSDINEITEKIIGCAIEVHRALGPGLLESAYEECLAFELIESGLEVARQLIVPLVYKKISLDCGYKLDMMVERKVIVELKTVEALLPIHEAQLLTYLRLCNCPVGLLINFHVPVLKQGIKRLVLGKNSPQRRRGAESDLGVE